MYFNNKIVHFFFRSIKDKRVDCKQKRQRFPRDRDGRRSDARGQRDYTHTCVRGLVFACVACQENHVDAA